MTAVSCHTQLLRTEILLVLGRFYMFQIFGPKFRISKFKEIQKYGSRCCSQILQTMRELPVPYFSGADSFQFWKHRLKIPTFPFFWEGNLDRKIGTCKTALNCYCSALFLHKHEDRRE